MSIVEFGLSSDSCLVVYPLIKLIGLLAAGDNATTEKLIEKLPNVHILIVNNLIPKNIAEIEKISASKDQYLLIIKTSLWALSNFAGSNSSILQQLFFDDDDQTLDKIVDIASKELNNFKEIFLEAMYFIGNLITSCNQEQF